MWFSRIAGNRILQLADPSSPSLWRRDASKMSPRCGGAVYRRTRRPIDRLLSLIKPVRRYHCLFVECSWVGNLPRDPQRPRDCLQPLDTPSTFG